MGRSALLFATACAALALQPTPTGADVAPVPERPSSLPTNNDDDELFARDLIACIRQLSVEVSASYPRWGDRCMNPRDKFAIQLPILTRVLNPIADKHGFTGALWCSFFAAGVHGQPFYHTDRVWMCPAQRKCDGEALGAHGPEAQGVPRFEWTTSMAQWRRSRIPSCALCNRVWQAFGQPPVEAPAIKLPHEEHQRLHRMRQAVPDRPWFNMWDLQVFGVWAALDQIRRTRTLEETLDDIFTFYATRQGDELLGYASALASMSGSRIASIRTARRYAEAAAARAQFQTAARAAARAKAAKLAMAFRRQERLLGLFCDATARYDAVLSANVTAALNTALAENATALRAAAALDPIVNTLRRAHPTEPGINATAANATAALIHAILGAQPLEMPDNSTIARVAATLLDAIFDADPTGGMPAAIPPSAAAARILVEGLAGARRTGLLESMDAANATAALVDALFGVYPTGVLSIVAIANATAARGPVGNATATAALIDALCPSPATEPPESLRMANATNATAAGNVTGLAANASDVPNVTAATTPAGSAGAPPASTDAAAVAPAGRAPIVIESQPTPPLSFFMPAPEEEKNPPEEDVAFGKVVAAYLYKQAVTKLSSEYKGAYRAIGYAYFEFARSARPTSETTLMQALRMCAEDHQQALEDGSWEYPKSYTWYFRSHCGYGAYWAALNSLSKAAVLKTMSLGGNASLARVLCADLPFTARERERKVSRAYSTTCHVAYGTGDSEARLAVFRAGECSHMAEPLDADSEQLQPWEQLLFDAEDTLPWPDRPVLTFYRGAERRHPL